MFFFGVQPVTDSIRFIARRFRLASSNDSSAARRFLRASVKSVKSSRSSKRRESKRRHFHAFREYNREYKNTNFPRILENKWKRNE